MIAQIRRPAKRLGFTLTEIEMKVIDGRAASEVCQGRQSYPMGVLARWLQIQPQKGEPIPISSEIKDKVFEAGNINNRLIDRTPPTTSLPVHHRVKGLATKKMAEIALRFGSDLAVAIE